MATKIYRADATASRSGRAPEGPEAMPLALSEEALRANATKENSESLASKESATSTSDPI